MDLKKLLGKGAHLASVPQKYLLNKAAEGLGVRGDENDSEASSQAIIENIASRVGIPEDSTVGNAAKAAGVAGLEMFGDPLGMLPIGKIAKFAPKIEALKALKLASESGQLDKLRKFKSGSNVLEAENAAQALSKLPQKPLGRTLVDTGEAALPNYGKIDLRIPQGPENLGKIIRKK